MYYYSACDAKIAYRPTATTNLGGITTEISPHSTTHGENKRDIDAIVQQRIINMSSAPNTTQVGSLEGTVEKEETIETGTTAAPHPPSFHDSQKSASMNKILFSDPTLQTDGSTGIKAARGESLYDASFGDAFFQNVAKNPSGIGTVSLHSSQEQASYITKEDSIKEIKKILGLEPQRKENVPLSFPRKVWPLFYLYFM